MTLSANLAEMERAREAYWLRFPSTSPFRLRWRAQTVRHWLHVIPGERILEVGAGSGLWTQHLSEALRGENPITAAAFNENLATSGSARMIPNARFVQVRELTELPEKSFDYVVGTAILCHDLYEQNLSALYRLLKPGGQLLFFEANYWNPQVFLKNHVPGLGRLARDARCHIGMRRYRLMRLASQQGFARVEITPYDIVHSLTPRWMIPTMQSLAFILEHAPVIREFCGTLYISAQRPGPDDAQKEFVNLATHLKLFDSISVVVPCHNEEMNILPLARSLLGYYGPYIHEIIFVNDNSTDSTSRVAHDLAQTEPRVKVLDRTMPNGVGRALRDGYAAATGRYILTMDGDFVQIVPEFRDMFDVIDSGHNGAIGSRFSHESLLVNYPFSKIVCNRGFHTLLNLFLPCHVRDISNNLKLYQAEILKDLKIEQHHFAANVETGLKPILAGYDVKEVPISWINRSSDMGTSSFQLLRLAPAYCFGLARMVWDSWRDRLFRAKDAKAKPAGEPPGKSKCDTSAT
ncbi:MAG: glycosyltransferase, partial [Candidatus Acidiferrales bacterium]